VGVTLSSFSAVSVNENWVPAFIEGSSKTVHKVSWPIDSSPPLSTPPQLAKLESLAGYFDTDAQSMAGLSYEAAMERFSSMVPYPHLNLIARIIMRLSRSHEKGRLKITNLFLSQFLGKDG
jgi:Vacuolar sorting-associated protein 13, N-terminal